MHQFTNRLIHETSPYLLQHAHNPVDWYPWGEEALQAAKAQNKPILVSIGYAACHWCHVMERESFEDATTAALMNAHFINIKIDREERPDLDQIYMDAVQAISGSGGWPLNVFLTPDTKPFFGGTYFPPVQAYNRASWKDVLTNIYQAFQTKRHEIDAQADNLTQHLINANLFGATNTTTSTAFFSSENLQKITQNILLQADTIWGGFGKAPKFPQTFSIQFLLRQHHFTGNKDALAQALLSLDKMIDGGMYDQIGGGFSRYSTDAEWFAPHFEKMLYDNALLIGVLAEAYQITKFPKYAATIRQTWYFLESELMHAAGGFYSALDADSEGIEGKFYTWTKSEITALLAADAPLFSAFYGVTESGNWEEGVNILWVQQALNAFASENGYEPSWLENKLAECRKKLLQNRNCRIKPQLDDKILLGWNALLITALSKAYSALGDVVLLHAAKRNMLFLEQHLQLADGSFLHTCKNGKAKIAAFLDDYAYLIQAYTHLQEITGNGEYLLKAKKLVDIVIANFSDTESSFFNYTAVHQTDVIIRKKEIYDGAIPSGNAIMAINLHYLSIMLDCSNWGIRAEEMLRNIQSSVVRYPTSFGNWAMLMQLMEQGMKEIVAVGEEAIGSLPVLLQKYVPNRIIQASTASNPHFPMLQAKGELAKTCFYFCKNYQCATPEYDLFNFLTII